MKLLDPASEPEETLVEVRLGDSRLGVKGNPIRRTIIFFFALNLFITAVNPFGPLIGLPSDQFALYHLGLDPNQLARFVVIVSIPTYLGIIFGYLRDRWSPFGLGDRGYLLLFAPIMAATCISFGFGTLTYLRWVVGSLVAIPCFLFISAATTSARTAVGQTTSSTGRLAMVWLVGAYLVGFAMNLAGGWLAVHVDYQRIEIGFGILIASLTVFGLFLPSKKREASVAMRLPGKFRQDFKVLVRSRALWCIVLIAMPVTFEAVNGAPLTYFVTRQLHGTVEDLGHYQAATTLALFPSMLAYFFLCRIFHIRSVLFFGLLLSGLQYVPLFFIHSSVQLIWTGVAGGIAAGFCGTGLLDLEMRACPPGLEGTALALVVVSQTIGGSLGSLIGASLYTKYGIGPGIALDFIAAVVTLPILFLFPKSVVASLEGESKQKISKATPAASS